MNKFFQSFGLKDGDIVNIEVQSNLASSSDYQLSTPAANNSKLLETVDIQSLVANLVKGIKVPLNRKGNQNMKDRSISLDIFNSLKQPGRIDGLRNFSSKLADIYEADPSNYGILK